MPPHELPGWLNQFQAVTIAGLTPLQTREHILAIAASIKASKKRGAWIAVALITAVERIGEAQRFVAKLLAERPVREKAEQVSQAQRSRRAVITPIP